MAKGRGGKKPHIEARRGRDEVRNEIPGVLALRFHGRDPLRGVGALRSILSTPATGHLHWGDKPHSVWHENRWDLAPGAPGCGGTIWLTPDSARSHRSKSTCTLPEGDLPTDCKACAEGARTCGNCLWEWKCWKVPPLQPSWCDAGGCWF